MTAINIFFVLLMLTIDKIGSDVSVISHCPKYFAFEPSNEEDTWNGIITLNSNVTINSVILDIKFDKPVIQLGNFFGPLTSDGDNINFRIRNKNHEITPDKPAKVKFYVKYDSFVDTIPPNIIKITFNGVELCSYLKEESNKIEDRDSISFLIRNKNKSCGSTIVTTTGLITHGFEAVKGQWPWQAALYEVKGKKRNFLCGGSLISTQHILTASHCVVQLDKVRPPEDFIVILGKHGLFVIGKEEQTFSLRKISVHKNFNSTHLFNDISILHLNTTAVYSDYVRPICLWSQDIAINNVVNKTGVAVGWGRDHENNPVTDLLMMAYLPVKDPLECIRFYPQFYAFVTRETNFCAGYANGTSVCNGDSGGGLFFAKPGTSGPNIEWEIRGIVSNIVSKIDRTCDTDYYAVFTDVAQYLDWIKEIMKT